MLCWLPCASSDNSGKIFLAGFQVENFCFVDFIVELELASSTVWILLIVL
jgi:hypothetical protein